MKNLRFEREVSLQQSSTLFEEFIRSQELEYFLADYGNPIHINKCTLNSPQSQQQFRGNGGGLLPTEAKVAALGEALQHYLSFYCIEKNFHEQVINKKMSEFLSTKQILLADLRCKSNSTQALKKPNGNIPDSCLAWLEYRSLSEDGVFYYPLELSQTSFDKFSFARPPFHLLWRANDTGQATGATFNEALLHSILECIEKDAYSIFLLRHIVKKHGLPLRIIDKNTLSTAQKNLISAIETHYQDELFLIDMTTSDLNIPTILIKFSQQERPVQAVGMAASLSKNCALEKALCEAVQCAELYNANSVEKTQACQKHLAKTPLLLKAFHCDIQVAMTENSSVTVDFKSISDYSNLNELPQQISFLKQTLAAKKFSIYYHVYYGHPATNNSLLSPNLHMIGVVIPGLETFFLIMSGKFVSLNQRGREILEQHQ